MLLDSTGSVAGVTQLVCSVSNWVCGRRRALLILAGGSPPVCKLL